MDSGQLTEPDPLEPPDPPSSPVRTSNRSFSPVKALILCKSHIINGVSFLDRSVFSKRFSISSFHLLLLSSASESFMSPDLNMKLSQILVYSASGVIWLSISSMILVLRSSSTSVPVAGLLVLGLGSSNGLITAECGLFLWVSLSPVAVTVCFTSQLVNLVVASCTGCSALITTSCFIHLPTIQVVSLRFSNLFTGVVLIVLECSHGLSLALVRPFTALDVVMSDISIPWVLFVDIYCPLSSSMECVPLPISSSTLSGFVSGSKTFKIRDTSDIEVLIKGSSKWCSISYVCVAISRIVNCALAAVSISGIISLNVVFNSQGLLSLCSLVVETRGLLHAISYLSVLYASILLCFIVIVVCLARMALLSCSINTFSLNGE
ncbi:hypothetical protein F2Q70_00019079 [Brassica cretica]|uniref:Transmembrane protein n=1 Tax=Brassica cretica TaxID=69181 RepID=A0A8S9GH86_BRACR|nr:hypothetical protein F2Q70_00019079 [Brassica cretica]